MHKLLSLWVFIPLVSSVFQIATSDTVRQAVQVSQEAQNAQTFNSILQVGIGIILATILARMQRTQHNTNKKVEAAVAEGVPKVEHEQLQAKVNQLETDLSLTNIQKRQVDIAQEQADTARSIVELLRSSGGREAAILDTQKAIETSLAVAVSTIRDTVDIGIALGDQSNANQDSLLHRVEMAEQSIIAAVKELKEVVDKRKTSSQPIAPITLPETSNP